jgi:hypothetical protein
MAHITFTIQEETISIDTIPANITLVDSIEEISQPQSDAQGISLKQNQRAQMMANKEFALQRLHMIVNIQISVTQNPTNEHMDQDITYE